MSPLSERTEMTVLGKKTTVVITPVWLIYITSNRVTPSLLVIHISVKISLFKADTWFYHI